MPGTAVSQPYVFISYASADRERVLPLVDALTRAGVAVWIDREGIHGGANYAREIAEAIKNSAALVLMASAMSLASRNVKQEVAVAWEYERPYLPLLLEAATIPDDLKYWLTAAQWIEVLERPEADWMPPVLAALAPLGIAPTVVEEQGIRLAGRERELALLREKLATTEGGRGGLVLIGGEAGIGKTTLAEATLAEAKRAGFSVLEGHCFDLAETPPYGPFIDLFARYAPSPSSPPLPAAFAERGTVGAVPNQMALFVQVQDFLAALGKQQPVAVLFDDLHWADPASLDLLRFLSRSLLSMPLLVLVTYRSDELTRKHPLSTLLPQLARESSAARVDLERLDDNAVRALVGERYGLSDSDSARLVTYLQTRAEGNALFVGELLRSLEGAGVLRRWDEGWGLGDLASIAVPPLLRQVIDGRLARLGDEAQRLLAVAAVIGHDVPLALWASAGSVDDERLLDTVEQATEARLCIESPDGERVRFAHALIRETLYEGILATRRRRLHRRVGEILTSSRAPDPDAVAYHFERAGDERAVDWLVAAGDRADRLDAYVTAMDRHARALALLGDNGDDVLRGWLLVRLGILYRFNDLERGLEYLESAEPSVRAARDPILTAYWRTSRGLLRCHAGRTRAGLRDLREGVATIKALPDLDGAVHALPACVRMALETDGESTYIAWLAGAGNLAEARSYGERMLAARAAEAGGGDVAPAGDAHLAMLLAYAGLGLPDRAMPSARQARDDYRRLGNHSMAIMASRFLLRYVLIPYRTERVGERRTVIDDLAYDQARVASGAFYSPEIIALQSQLLGCDCAVVEGNWAETRRAAMALHESGLTGIFLRQVAGALGWIARSQGDTDLGWQMVRLMFPRGADDEPGNRGFHHGLPLQQLAPALALDEHDLPTARAWLESYDRWLAWSGAVLGRSNAEAMWAQYHRQVGDMDQAREHAERALACASEPRQPLALLAAHQLMGELDTATGQYDDAARHLDASLGLADACQAPYERALTLLAMAELRAATGEAETARVLLEEVRAICEPLGAKPALARADALAARLMNR